MKLDIEDLKAVALSCGSAATEPYRPGTFPVVARADCVQLDGPGTLLPGPDGLAIVGFAEGAEIAAVWVRANLVRGDVVHVLRTRAIFHPPRSTFSMAFVGEGPI